MINLVVLRGSLSRPASVTELPSGTRMAALEVTVRQADGPAETVPVSLADPPTWVSELDTGSKLVVLGRVRRRFFRAGGATQSRTEVVAQRVVQAGNRRRADTLLGQAAECLDKARRDRGM